jgi:hypothetical protein
MKCVDVFRLTLPRFDDWIILAQVNFMSPGTGKTLSKNHECCVYLVDQVRKLGGGERYSQTRRSFLGLTDILMLFALQRT